MRQPDEQGADDRAAAPPAWWDTALLVVCVTLPACLAVAHAANSADAAHDEAVVRAVGLGWTGALRALDAPWCALFAWVPLGTRALRAALASAMACGVGGGIVFTIARALVARMAGSGRLGAFAAAIASLTATLSPPWQTEAAAPAGSTLGGVLGLAPLAILLARGVSFEARVVTASLAAGVAFSYEPLVGLVAGVSCGAWVVLERRGAGARGWGWRSAVAFVVGCAPFGVALGRRGAELATSAGVLAQAAGERGESLAGMPAVFAREDVGIVSCLAIVAGAVLAFREPRARGLGGTLAVGVGAGVVAMIAGAAAGPNRYGAPVLAAAGGAYALAAVGLQAIVRVVDEAKIPFAHASAVLIVILELALPARAADDASARAEQRSPAAIEAWDDAAFEDLPAGAAFLVASPRVQTRLLAARAAGEMRADVALVPLSDLWSRMATRELARDVKLEPLWHDSALLGVPQEVSLSTLASWRPLIAPYDPTWDRALARHFVPIGLFARFEPEPRGAGDRRRALDDFGLVRPRLAQALDGDPELRALTASLLRARTVTLAATSERDVVGHALEDLRPFSPRDPVAIEIVRRLSLSRGAIDVRDLQ